MRMTVTPEQIEYLAELGVSILPSLPATTPVVQAPMPVAVACPPSPAQQAVFVSVAMPEPEASWWSKNSWWIRLAGSAAVLLLQLFVFLVMKGCNP